MSSAYTRACWSTAESGFSVRLDHSRPCSNVLIEAGDDAKVVAPAAERQPQVRVLLLAGLDNGAVGENNLERNDLIAGLALPRAKVGDAAAAAEPCHADAGNTAAHVAPAPTVTLDLSPLTTTESRPRMSTVTTEQLAALGTTGARRPGWQTRLRWLSWSRPRRIHRGPTWA